MKFDNAESYYIKFRIIAAPTNIQKLVLIYMLMNAEGRFSEKDRNVYEQICKNTEVNTYYKDKLDALFNTLDIKENTDNSDYIIETIKSLFKESSFYQHGIDFNKNEQSNTLWTMINLSAKNGTFSVPKRKIVDYLISRWNSDKGLTATMFDTTETIFELEKKKEWVASSEKSRKEKIQEIKAIEQDVKKLWNDMKINISESDI